MAVAPGAIERAFGLIKTNIPQAQMGGIVGDARHSFGYHLARNELPPGDYSNILALDKQGSNIMASALDVTLPANLMKICTARLHDFAVAHDYRLRGLREFCGTLDGVNTFPWDLSNNSSEGLNSWDDSHLWHIHLSGYRAYEENDAVWLDIAAAFCGGKPVPHPHPAHWLRLPWPNYMGPGDYFGLASGPAHSHGGYYPRERPAVRAIQVRLKNIGFDKGQNTIGLFGPKTKDAVTAWQKKNMPGTQFYGQVWSDDWTRLFTW